jgi:N-acetyl-anhydromuramyl-L-alanine amidase AmpD
MASDAETGVVMPDAGLRFWAAAPSPNRGGTCRVPGDVRGIVIHSVEGAMASAISTFARIGGPSAHYGIDTDGTVVAFVPEGDVAFHVAAFGSRPSLNRNHPQWLPAYDGRWSAVNACTVGIELAGFAGRSFTAAQYASLGALCAGIATRWGFVPDASRVVSHASLQSDRSDPGESFDWEALFAAVQASLPTAATVSDGDREILEVVRGLGADAAGVRGWIEKLGAYEAQQ